MGKGSNISKVKATISIATIQVAACLVLAEIVLRIHPAFISPAFLARFPSTLKSDVAQSIGLPTGAGQVRISSAERSDKGVDILLAKPLSTYLAPADSADAQAGAVEQFQADALGFCNPLDQSTEKADIVVIGGSLPNCAGVSAENNFTEKLEHITERSTYNLALGGTGPYEFVELLKRFGLAMKPKAVVMTYSEANELRDCRQHLEHVVGKKSRGDSRKDWVFPFTTSYALSFLKAGIEVAIKQGKAKFSDDFTYSVIAGGTPAALNVRNGDRDELQSALALVAGELSPSLCEAPLAEFGRLAKANDFIPLVVLTPAAYSTYGNTVSFSDARWKQPMTDYNAIQSAWMKANAERLGFVFFDATPGMREKAESEPLLYFPSNAHLTVAGHQALADVTAVQVRQLLNRKP
jgi:hypothetical protein